ncbi:MAG: hypothetical protein JWM59_723, partial [Verrucomicrobiales bacterium]|nr:hypothetical protein [Verrucomicrobiales bacterium]
SQAMLFGPVCPMIVFQLNAFGFTAGARNSGMGAVIRRQDEDFRKKRLLIYMSNSYSSDIEARPAGGNETARKSASTLNRA